jgi:hypothetical protein
MSTKKGIERHHDTGRVHQLVIPYQEGVTPDNNYDLLHKAISSVFMFAKNGIQLYSMDYHIYMGDIHAHYPHGVEGIINPFTLFVDKNIPSTIDLRPKMVGEKRVDLDDFSVDNLCQKAIELLHFEIEQNKDEESIPVWNEISFRGMTVPIPSSYAQDNFIPLVYKSWTDHYPIEHQGDVVLAHGPLKLGAPYPPIFIDLGQVGGILTLDIYMRWSYFWDEAFEGYHLIQNYIKELKKEGWVEE